jgi:hypothetical protein
MDFISQLQETEVLETEIEIDKAALQKVQQALTAANESMDALKKAKPHLFTDSSSTHKKPNPPDGKLKKVSAMTETERQAAAKKLGIPYRRN